MPDLLSRHALGELLDTALAEVTLSSRASDKFDPLARALGGAWGLAPERIAIKALADAKNRGNRIAEATRGSAERLVLLSAEDVDPEALARVYGERALVVVPTVLAVRSESGWTIRATLLAESATDPFDLDVPLVRVRVSAPPVLSEEERAALERSVENLSGRSSETDVVAALGGDALVERAVLVKRASDARNIGNRVGEAIGRRPAVLVLVVPSELSTDARRILREQLPLSPETRGWLVVETDSGLAVERVVRRDEDPAASGPDASAAGAETSSLPTSATAPEEKRSEPPDTEPLRYRRLERVATLLRHLPLDADAAQLYEEHRGVDDRLAYETRTLGYLRVLLGRDARAFVVLTGNAGHGKTHMCRQLLESEGSGDVMAALGSDPEGELRHRVEGLSRPVRVVKDLSELEPPERAAERLAALLAERDSHVLVCANEGRLRDVVGRRPDALAPLLATLERGLESGGISLPESPEVHVVNLNHQAATAGEGGFLAHVLRHFLDHENAWRVCRSCAASDACPILANRRYLALPSRRRADDPIPREALIEAVQVAEESGHVLTFRETIAFVAWIVTGALGCADVERMHRRGDEHAEFDRFRLLELLFEPPPEIDAETVLPLLGRLRRLDPGRVAFRPVDEKLHLDLEREDALGTGLFDEGSRQPVTRAELVVERDEHRELVRGARREAWLGAPRVDERGVERVARLGLRHHHVFRRLLDEPDDAFVTEAVRTVVRGLHVIQGAVGVETKTQFHLVDPAFGRSGNLSAIIARSLRQRPLRLRSESAWWRERDDGGSTSVLDAVEWIDRRVVLLDDTTPEAPPLLVLDLLGFEFVLDAADGVVMREFHSAARRRVLRTLARLAERHDAPEDDIRVLVDQREGTITVARDGTVVLERGG